MTAVEKPLRVFKVVGINCFEGEKLKFFNSKLSSKPLNTLAYRSVIVGNGLKEDPFISAFF